MERIKVDMKMGVVWCGECVCVCDEMRGDEDRRMKRSFGDKDGANKGEKA